MYLNSGIWNSMNYNLYIYTAETMGRVTADISQLQLYIHDNIWT